MKRKSLRITTGILLLVSLLALNFYKPFQEFLSVPKHVVLFQGSEETFAVSAPVTATSSMDDGAVSVFKENNSLIVQGERPGSPRSSI